jgi:hypothetical protein
MKDLTGRVFGELIALEPCGKDKNGHYFWLCRCRCGNETKASSSNLLRGHVASCGCSKQKIGAEKKLKKIDDLIKGKTINNILFVERHHQDKRGVWIWSCVCHCGAIFYAYPKNAKSGKLKSCGCLKGNYKHGLYKDKKYSVWCGMLSRCSCPTCEAYSNYGGRGIKVCEEWSDFINFNNWAEQSGYEEGLELDRIDNNGDYSPENCRWVTHTENNRNKRTNRYITYEGDTKCTAEWAEILGVSIGLLLNRLNNNWSFEDIIETPPNTPRKSLKICNQLQNK